MIRRWFHLIFDRHLETPRMRKPEWTYVQLLMEAYEIETNRLQRDLLATYLWGEGPREFGGMKVFTSPFVPRDTVWIMNEIPLVRDYVDPFKGLYE